MKKIAIIGLSVLLSACVSETYITDVTSESYREDYKSDAVSKPIMASESAVVEQDVKPEVVKMTAKPEEKKVVKLTPKEQVKPVKIVPPSKKQAGIQRFGYTIQVVAVGSQAKVDQFANKLPQNGQPIWEKSLTSWVLCTASKSPSIIPMSFILSPFTRLECSFKFTRFISIQPSLKICISGQGCHEKHDNE